MRYSLYHEPSRHVCGAAPCLVRRRGAPQSWTGAWNEESASRGGGTRGGKHQSVREQPNEPPEGTCMYRDPIRRPGSRRLGTSHRTERARAPHSNSTGCHRPREGPPLRASLSHLNSNTSQRQRQRPLSPPDCGGRLAKLPRAVIRSVGPTPNVPAPAW